MVRRVARVVGVLARLVCFDGRRRTACLCFDGSLYKDECGGGCQFARRVDTDTSWRRTATAAEVLSLWGRKDEAMASLEEHSAATVISAATETVQTDTNKRQAPSVGSTRRASF